MAALDAFQEVISDYASFFGIRVFPFTSKASSWPCASCFVPSPPRKRITPTRKSASRDLPSVTAKSKDATDVLAASVEIILRDKEVCAGRTPLLRTASREQPDL